MDHIETVKKFEDTSGEDLTVTHRERKRFDSQQSTPVIPYPAERIPYAEHGALIDRSQTAEAVAQRGYNKGLLWPRIRYHLREPFSEFMGTFVLILFGDGGVAQVVLSKEQKGNYQSISWAWVSLLQTFIPVPSY